jgi:proline iminopeptidase
MNPTLSAESAESAQSAQPAQPAPPARLMKRGAAALLHLGHLQRGRWLVAAGVVAVAGLLTAVAMPRGPVTTLQALVALCTGFFIGLLAGWLTRSRWAMLLAPAAFAVVFELVRFGESGPTVDWPPLTDTYGTLALVVGRGFHGIVQLLPMLLGAAYGAGLARREAGYRSRGPWALIRRTIAGVVALALVGLGVLSAWPAQSPAIRDAHGSTVPGSVAELTRVRLGGHDQWLEIRGQSIDKPVLLYLSGGPGQSDLPFSRVLFSDLARDFVVVGWDQRGTGKSYPALDPATLTLDRAVSDTVELTNYLRQRFGEQKIYLMGESWGSTLGVLAVQRHPELYYAWIGSGQMVSQTETDRRLYQDALAYAARTANTELAQKMRSYGPPPYDGIWGNAFVFSLYDQLAGPYTPPAAYTQRGESNFSTIGPMGVFGIEYSLVEKVNVLRGLADTLAVMYPQLRGIDFRRSVPRLQVPVYLLEGEHELAARRDLANEWYRQLSAPSKHLYAFADAGHSAAFEEFQPLHNILTQTVLPQTYPSSRSQ